MLRIVKVLLVVAVLAWAVVGLWDNLTSLGGMTRAVTAVTSMTMLPPGGTELWRATTNMPVILAGVAFILLFKAATAGLCATGAWRMWGRRRGDAGEFAKAKSLALAGCSVGVFGLFVGWTVIAGEWFLMYRAESQVADELAFRYGGFIGLIALLVATRDE